MGLDFLLLWLVLFSFVIAIGAPAYFMINALFGRPKEKVTKYKAKQERALELFTPEITGEALFLFQKAWNEKIKEQDLTPIFNKLNVYWKKDPIDLGQSYVINGKTFSMAAGLTRTKKDIDVWIFDKDKKPDEIKISDTAFAHELVHIALWSLEGDPDADHEAKMYKGWTEKHTEVEKLTNTYLKEKGL